MPDRPLKRKYARIERERRFLLERLPAQVDVDDFDRLRDCYLADSHLRLRRVESPDGELRVVKLGQKILDPENPQSARHREMTTIYLDEREAKLFESLPGRVSTKRRYKLPEQGWTFVIDVYEAPLAAAGTIVCEVECDTDAQLDAIVMPLWASREITEEPEWSGARLAE